MVKVSEKTHQRLTEANYQKESYDATINRALNALQFIAEEYGEVEQ